MCFDSHIHPKIVHCTSMFLYLIKLTIKSPSGEQLVAGVPTFK